MFMKEDASTVLQVLSLTEEYALEDVGKTKYIFEPQKEEEYHADALMDMKELVQIVLKLINVGLIRMMQLETVYATLDMLSGKILADNAHQAYHQQTAQHAFVLMTNSINPLRIFV